MLFYRYYFWVDGIIPDRAPATRTTLLLTARGLVRRASFRSYWFCKQNIALHIFVFRLVFCFPVSSFSFSIKLRQRGTSRKRPARGSDRGTDAYKCANCTASAPLSPSGQSAVSAAARAHRLLPLADCLALGSSAALARARGGGVGVPGPTAFLCLVFCLSSPDEAEGGRQERHPAVEDTLARRIVERMKEGREQASPASLPRKIQAKGILLLQSISISLSFALHLALTVLILLSLLPFPLPTAALTSSLSPSRSPRSRPSGCPAVCLSLRRPCRRSLPAMPGPVTQALARGRERGGKDSRRFLPSFSSPESPLLLSLPFLHPVLPSASCVLSTPLLARLGLLSPLFIRFNYFYNGCFS